MTKREKKKIEEIIKTTNMLIGGIGGVFDAVSMLEMAVKNVNDELSTILLYEDSVRSRSIEVCDMLNLLIEDKGGKNA